MLTVIAFGCVPLNQYGKLRVGHGGDARITIEQLYENQENYRVYYCGVHEGLIGAIMFDPKGDGRKMVGHEWWAEVEDKELIWEMIKLMRINETPARVMQILGPENRVYGYLYTQHSHVVIKKVDDDTLWIDELVAPPTVVGLEDRSML